jgi:hypothetical protein
MTLHIYIRGKKKKKKPGGAILKTCPWLQKRFAMHNLYNSREEKDNKNTPKTITYIFVWTCERRRDQTIFLDLLKKDRYFTTS